MAGLNEICVCSCLILCTCFISETTQTGFDCTYSHIGVVQKKKTCRASLILVRISQAARFVGPTLNPLSSRHHFGPSWMFIPKLHVFMAVKWFRLARWVMRLRSRVHRHRHLGGTCCLILSRKDECSKILRNSTTDYTEPHPIRPQYKRLQVPQFFVYEIQNYEFGTSFHVMCM